jgi:hypothetical protein
MQSLVTVCFWVGCFLQPCSVVTAAAVTTEFYDFKTNVHLVGFYSILSLMMHGTMNVKL